MKTWASVDPLVHVWCPLIGRPTRRGRKARIAAGPWVEVRGRRIDDLSVNDVGGSDMQNTASLTVQVRQRGDQRLWNQREPSGKRRSEALETISIKGREQSSVRQVRRVGGFEPVL